MKREPQGRLELTWMGKDRALIPDPGGKYDYSWADLTDPRVTEVRPLNVTTHIGNRDDGGIHDNLLIEGESGDVLRALLHVPELAARYEGKVRCVYIDPPFNTKQTFDHYEDSLEHSVWLTMMRDRLLIIERLLSDNGSVWVHLDESEAHRMRCLMDEVFGPECHAASVTWKSSDNSNNDAKQFSEDHNVIHVYTKKANWLSNRLVARPDQVPHFKNPDQDPRGPWFDGNPLNSPSPRKDLMYDLTSPSGVTIPYPPNGWRWSKDTLQNKIDTGEIRFRDNESGILRRTYLNDHLGLPPSDLWTDTENTGASRTAKSELKRLFPGIASSKLFSTPKPERFIQRILQVATEPGDIVLDCFAGSGTTAAVAHKMGRRWVTCELIASTVSTFTRPRLEMVVRGQDSGGVTFTAAGRELPQGAELPEGMSLDEAQKFNSLLSKVVKSDASLDADSTIKKLRHLTKTKPKKPSKTWDGGGGFDLAFVAPSIYEVDDETGQIYLTDKATNGTFSRGIAAQLGFGLDDRPPFVGLRGGQRLLVIDGIIDAGVVETAVHSLEVGEQAVIVGQGATHDARKMLETFSPYSQIRITPNDFFREGATH